MAPTIPPDPDMRVADSGNGATLRGTASGLEAQAMLVGSRAAEVRASGAGTRIEADLAAMDKLQKSLDQAAGNATAGADFVDALAAAAAAFRRDAPTPAEIEAAWEAWQAARRALQAADADNAGAARAAAAEAEKTYHLLVKQREDALKAHRKAEDAAKAKFQEQTTPAAPETELSGEGEGTVHRKIPEAEQKTATEKTPPTPAPTGTPTAAVPAGTPAPTRLAAGGAPPASSSAAASSPADAAAALAAAQARQQQQPMPAMPQVPQTAPAAAAGPGAAPAGAGGQRAGTDRRAFDGSDLDRALGPVAALAMGAPMSAAPMMSASSPAPAPAPTPTVTGTSHTGLVTGSDVSGRAEPARGAFGAQTNLSAAAGTATESAPLHRGAAGQPMGHGGMPMVPPMMGGMGGGGAPKKDADPITSYSAEQALLHGHETVGEAVPGGTIAQRRDD